MKAFKYILFALLACLAGCYVMDVPEAGKPDPLVRLSLDDDPFSGKETINLDYEESITLDFTYEDISRVVAEAPLGWTAVVKMTGGSGTIKISAPKYGTKSVQDGVITLKMYDGSGSFKEKKLTVHAVEGVLEFALDGFDISGTKEFTLGSRTTVKFNCSPSFKNIDFDLPTGWKGIEKTRGTFTIIAPDLTVETGDASGIVTITPVSWSGVKETSLAVSFAVSVDPTKPTFEFVEEETSFTFGETKTLEITAKGLKDIVYPAVPAGWTIDWSGINEGTVTVTSPAKDAAAFDGCASLVLQATSNADNSAISTNASVVRLYGINSAEELLAFRAVYEAVDANDPETSPEVIGKWMVDEELSLNADILLTTDMLQSKAYVIKYLNVPLNGNGHAFELDLDCNAAVGGVFQYTRADIRNLKITGRISNEYSTDVTVMGALVARPYSMTFENVDCSADVHYKVDASVLKSSRIGGIAGCPPNNEGATFKNCSYSGTLTCDNDLASAGGILGATDLGKPGALSTMENCKFSGAIILNHQIANAGVNSRVGGILGEIARLGTISGCESSGTLTVNAGGKRFASTSGFGFGGICGRITAPASGYTMAATIKDVTFTGTVKLNNGAADEDRTRYGQILGCSPNANSDGILTKSGWHEEGTLTL